MPEIDEFARYLLEESKRFLEKASDATDKMAESAYLHAAVLLAFSSLEAHVNAVGDEFEQRPEFSVHEKGVILEREVRLENGEFVLTNSLKMSRLEDRILFLHSKFASPLDRSRSQWSHLKEAIDLRNQLTHPKEAITITEDAVSRAIVAVISTLDSLYQAVYGKPFPAAGRGLQSKLSF